MDAVAAGKLTPFDRVLGLIVELDAVQPSENLPHQLDELFIELADPEPSNLIQAVEGMIWALWSSHEDGTAAQRMEQLIAAIAQQRYRAALRIADGLVARWPDWAEAWNKRATVRFLMEQDAASAADIEATLRLEPRHFGALSGFGQICLRQDEPVSARLAFERALRINPHLEGMRELVDDLRADFRPTVN